METKLASWSICWSVMTETRWITLPQFERGEWVREALDELSDQMRSVVQLVYYEGMKYREAADVLSIPVGTVKSRLHSAIAKLNEFWTDAHVHPK